MTVTRWNDPVSELFGYDTDEAVGRHVGELLPDSTLGELDGDGTGARTAVGPYTEWNVIADGTERCCEWHVRSIDDGEGSVDLLAFVTDVTEKRRHARQLEAIAEKTQDAIYIKDARGEYEFINQAGAAMVGFTPPEVRGRRDVELFDLPDGQELFDTDRRVLESEAAVVEQERTVIDGTEHVFAAEKYPYYDDDGELIGVMGTSRDITESKRLEDLLLTFHEHATDESVTHSERVSELIDAVRTGLGVENAHVVQIADAEGSHEIVDAVGNDALTPAGSVSELAGTYCRLVADRREMVVFEHASEEGMADDPAYDGYGLETYVGAPITVNDEFWGTLCFADQEPRAEPFTETELTVAKLAAEWIGRELMERRREREVERQNEMLEELVGVLTHDAKSQALSAQGHIQLVQEDDGVESQSLSKASKSIDDLQSLIHEAATVVEQQLSTTQTSDARVSLDDAIGVALDRLDERPDAVMVTDELSETVVRSTSGPGPPPVALPEPVQERGPAQRTARGRRGRADGRR